MPRNERSDLVLRRDGAQPVEELALAERAVGGQAGQGERARQADRGGDGLVDQRVERRQAEDVEHLRDLGLVGAEVAAGEGVGRRERGGRVGGGVSGGGCGR